MLGVVVFVLAVVKLGVSTPDNAGICSASWEGHNPWEFGNHARLWPQQCWKSCKCKGIQHCCAALRQSQNKRNVVGSKVWPVTKHYATTCKRVLKWMWHVTSNYVGSCWPTNYVASVCVRLKTTFLCSSLCKYVFFSKWMYFSFTNSIIISSASKDWNTQ